MGDSRAHSEHCLPRGAQGGGRTSRPRTSENPASPWPWEELHGATLTNHAIDRKQEHRALRGRGSLAQVLHNQRAMGKDVDKLAQVEEPNLLEVLPPSPVVAALQGCRPQPQASCPPDGAPRTVQ